MNPSSVRLELEEETTFNLLELSNGVTAVLAEEDIPNGVYKEIRLHVVDAGIVMDDEEGTEYDLKVPSGNASGLKIKLDPSLEVEGGAYAEVLLDFDVSRSFVMRGNMKHGKGKVNGFIFKPVVRAVAHVQTTAGDISGNVTDGEENPVENALLTLVEGEDTITSANTDEEGFYAMMGILPGDYSLILNIDDEDVETTSVSVVAGESSEQDFVVSEEEGDDTGDISGNVIDGEENPVEDALLTLVVEEDTITSANTDEEGFYAMSDIPAGDYSLILNIDDEDVETASVSVEAGESTEQDFEISE